MRPHAVLSSIDPRSTGDRLRERAAVDRQLQRWVQLRSDTALRRQLLDGVRRRRAGRPDLVQFDILPDGDGSEVLAVRGELLVRASDLGSPAVRALLEAWDLRAVPVGCLEERVVRLVGRSVRDRLPEVLAEVRSLGVPVSAHHVVPMGAWVKGLTGPEPSTGGRPFPGVVPSERAVRIAVLDTGIDPRPRTDGWLDGLAHAGNADPLDAIPSDGTLDPGAGHGTFAAGIVQQVARSASVEVRRVLDSDGIGSDVRVACAMLRAAEAGAEILSLSLGTHTVDDEPPIAMQTALDLLADRHPDVVVVAAAGNDGSDRPCWPAAFPDVVAVAGLTPSLGPAQWSNRGDWVTCSTVAEGIVSTYVEGRRSADPPAVFGPDAWAGWTGTSFGAPQVAAAVATRCAADGVRPRRALVALLADRPAEPGFGTVVEILAGT